LPTLKLLNGEGRMKNEGGFTLIEIMSCLILVSVLTGIASPMFKTILSRQKFNGEISKLVGELHKARSFAMKSNARVVFSYTESGYKSFIDDGQGGGTEKDWVQQPGEKVLADVRFRDRYKIALDESSFPSQRTFFSGKTGVTGGSIVLKGDDGQKSKVIVNLIGRVRVVKL
jgi:prepilin-type N-terminal cleavage/methylation domain-containing protein